MWKWLVFTLCCYPAQHRLTEEHVVAWLLFAAAQEPNSSVSSSLYTCLGSILWKCKSCVCACLGQCYLCVISWLLSFAQKLPLTDGSRLKCLVPRQTVIHIFYYQSTVLVFCPVMRQWNVLSLAWSFLIHRRCCCERLTVLLSYSLQPRAYQNMTFFLSHFR